MTFDSGPWGSPDAAMARIDEQIAEAQERAQRASQVRAEMDAVRGQATSSRGEVRATVDVSGRLVDLVLTDDALALRPAELSRMILETGAAAAAKAARTAVELTSDAFGDASAVTERLRAELAERTPARTPDSDIRYV